MSSKAIMSNHYSQGTLKYAVKATFETPIQLVKHEPEFDHKFDLEYDDNNSDEQDINSDEQDINYEMDIVHELCEKEMDHIYGYCQSYEDKHPDTWFPDFRTEKCCNGFINRCKIAHRKRIAQTGIVNTNNTNHK